MFKNCTPLWREAHLQVKMHKTPHGRSHFGSSDVQKWHAAVARSIFVSQNVEKLTGTDHFLEVWCRKIARRCGAKYICKSKCAKHHMFGPLFEVPTSEKCTPLWRKAHLQVKMLKKLRVREHFLKFRCWKIVRGCGAKHIRDYKCAKHLVFAPFRKVSNSLANKLTI